MLFNSFEFLLFAAVFFGVWPWARRHPERRYLTIIVFSMFFFGWATWWYPLLLIGNGGVDFMAALAMRKSPERRKLLLVLSIVANLGTLSVFKYAGFLVGNWNAIGGWAGFPALSIPHIVLPIGISFTTFQSMSYTIDVYRGEIEPTRNPRQFFAYLSLFPQLIAGPIQRARDLLPQLAHDHEPTDEQRWEGMRLIASGYFKKTVIADNFAPIVNQAFGQGIPLPSGAYWWVIAAMYSFQIYFDFSGYSDIARGLGKWMGYDFSLNFNHPYHATSFRGFWQRWHISLSTWFRDYVYIPLGGGRKHPNRNMWITMLLSGLWHGANWTFVAWGAIHAAAMHVERQTGWPDRLHKRRGGLALASFIVLLTVVLSWVMFRAQNIGQFGQIITLMLDPRQIGMGAAVDIGAKGLGLLGLCVVFECIRAKGWSPGFQEGIDCRMRVQLQLAAMLTACVFLRGPGGAFIYFQF